MTIQILEYCIENTVSSSKSSNCKLPEGEKYPCPVLSLCLVLLDHTNPHEGNKATVLPRLSVLYVLFCLVCTFLFLLISSVPIPNQNTLCFCAIEKTGPDYFRNKDSKHHMTDNEIL